MMPKLAKQVICNLAEYIKTKGITFVNLQLIETNNSENYTVIRIQCKLSIRHENTCKQATVLVVGLVKFKVFVTNLHRAPLIVVQNQSKLLYLNSIENCSVIKLILSQFVLYTVTLDYKGLVLLMAKINDEDFQLGGQGLALEFCIFCLAWRVSFLNVHLILKCPNKRMCLELF